MRGDDREQGSMFSYRSLEDRIPSDHPLRALLLQVLFSVRSERQLMEELEYNLLYRWFVGLGMDDAVWVPTTFTKNRDRLLEGDVARAFFDAVLAQADGFAERAAALEMLGELPEGPRVTLGADRG